MPKKLAEFEQWEFDEDELPLACCYSDLQLKYLKSERTVVILEMTKLAFEPSSPNAERQYILEREYLRGKLEQLDWLISIHNDNVATLEALYREQQESQKGE